MLTDELRARLHGIERGELGELVDVPGIRDVFREAERLVRSQARLLNADEELLDRAQRVFLGLSGR